MNLEKRIVENLMSEDILIPNNFEDTEVLWNNTKEFNRILIRDNNHLKNILVMVLRYLIIRDNCLIDSNCTIPNYLKTSEEVPFQCYQCITKKISEVRDGK